MTEIAYMVRDDSAQQGTAMREHTAVIREWLADPPFVFARTDPKKYQQATALTASSSPGRSPLSTDDAWPTCPPWASCDVRTGRFSRGHSSSWHPYKQDCDLLREIVEAAFVPRRFVIIGSARDMVRASLDGRGAVNLHTGVAHDAPDPVQLEAARCWVDEQHNGQVSGNGRAAVVQLLRAFNSDGEIGSMIQRMRSEI